MSRFNVYVKDGPEVRSFVARVGDRLNEPNLFKNPFTGEVSYNPARGKIHINLTNIYPNLTWLGLLLTLPVFFFRFISLWFLLISVPFFFVGLMHTRLALYLGLKLGLRKAGYKDKTKMEGWFKDVPG